MPLILQVAVGQMFMPKAPSQPSASQARSTQPLTGETNTFDLLPASAIPAWPLGSKIELHFHVSTSPFPGDTFSERGQKEILPSFVWDNIVRDLKHS